METQQIRANAWVPRYLRMVGETPLLDRERERDLAIRMRSGRDAGARDELILANLKFAYSICRRFQGMGLSMEDLVAEAHIGLIEAADRFDPERNVRVVSLEEPLSAADETSPGGPCRGDLIGDRAGGDPESSLQHAERRAVVLTGLRELLPRERFILECRCGLMDEHPMTLSEVSRRIGVSREMVRLIEVRAREKMLRRIRTRHRRPGRPVRRSPAVMARSH